MPNAKTQDSQGADIIDVVLVKLFEGPNAFPSSYVLRNSGLSIDYRARAHKRVREARRYDYIRGAFTRWQAREKAREEESPGSAKPRESPDGAGLLAWLGDDRRPTVALVAQYTRVLNILEARCAGDREMIRDIALGATQLIARDFSRDVKVLDFLKQLEAATSSTPRGSDCTPISVTLIALIGKDQPTVILAPWFTAILALILAVGITIALILNT